MYAIVRAGGRQEKVSLGDTIEVDRLDGQPGDKVNLAPVLVVDGSTVTSSADELARWPVSAEIVGGTRGPKITILKFKNKTGYRKRQGHRSHLTALRVVSIGDQKVEPVKKTAVKAKPEAAKAVEPKAESSPTTKAAAAKAEPKAAKAKPAPAKETKASSTSTTKASQKAGE